MSSTAPPTRPLLKKILLAAGATLVVLLVLELALRYCVLHASFSWTAVQDPGLYSSPTEDRFWILDRVLSVREGEPTLTAEAPGEAGMRTDFGATMRPDPRLGWYRRSNLKMPCFESNSLGARGPREYPPATPGFVFLGDSYVESTGCHRDALPARLQQLVQTDVANFGISSYGFDQVYLLFQTLAPRFDKKNTVFLIGSIWDDFARLLLSVRSAPKPYFEVQGQRLVLHTEHFSGRTQAQYYDENGWSGSFVFAALRRAMELRTADTSAREDEVQRATAIIEGIVRGYAEHRDRGAQIVFVVITEDHNLYQRCGTMGFVSRIKEVFPRILSRHKLPLIDLSRCLDPQLQSGAPHEPLYAAEHLTPHGNKLVAACLKRQLHKLGLVK